MIERHDLSQRAAGLLLHPTSLPGPHGCGDFGPAAYEFIDFLVAAGQTWWQMLPITPIGAGHSPYQGPSALAGNPLLVSLRRLYEDGLLMREDLSAPARLGAGRVDYPATIRFREQRLRRAYERFIERTRHRRSAEFDRFVSTHRAWLEDYALFSALCRAHHGASWVRWPIGLKQRRPEALREARRALRSEIDFHRFVQFEFGRQASALRNHCHARGIGLIGDVPIYVSLDSADVWAHQELFQLDSDGRPTAVAGVPPDYFSRDGQLWGNPLYRWNLHARHGFHWWIERFRATLEFFDTVRLDHFIGFQRYWSVPGSARNARRGRWLPGPRDALFHAVRRALHDPRMIAEDLGAITPAVEALRDRLGFPGMRVLQFAFDPSGQSRDLPHHHVRNCVVYTGTHDNDTTVGWIRDRQGRNSTTTPEQARRERAFARAYLGCDGRDIHWNMIRLALSSVANTAIVPVQDVLGLGSEARMNRPGTVGNNWRWRLTATQLTRDAAARLRSETQTFGRLRRTR